MEGPTLRMLLEREGPLAVPAVVRIGCDTLDALTEAHRRGIVHRDVKPENIVLSLTQGAGLLDFGIAKAIAVSTGERLTRSGFTVGTSHYMSPEQINGDPLDHRSDLYSLGCVLFEALTGVPPFHDPLEQAVLRMHTLTPAPDVRGLRADIPTPLAETVARALNKTPRERWESAEAMLAALLTTSSALEGSRSYGC